MPRKKRDHKAEYQAAKNRATKSGYKSQREYKQVRKALNLPRNSAPIPAPIMRKAEPRAIPIKSSDPEVRRMRKEAAAWSRKHSHMASSRYFPGLTDEQVRKYHKAFVEPLKGEGRSKAKKAEKLRRLKDYLVPDIYPDNEQEWTGKYGHSAE